MSHSPLGSTSDDVGDHKYASEHLEELGGGEKLQHGGDGHLSSSTAHVLPGQQQQPAGHHVQGNVALVSASGHTRLVPTPSDSPRDPLTWSTWKKAGIIGCVCWFSVFSLSALGGLGALAPFFFGLYARQGVDPNTIARLLTWPSLFTGLGNFAFLPLCLVIGRRPVFIISSIMFIVACATAATAGTSFDSHLNSRIAQGFAAGATESLLPLIITDITFLHQRSTAFGVYWAIQTGFGAILNLASSYEAINLSWPWYYWIFVILGGAGFIGAIFLLPETRFERPATAIDGQMTKVDAYGNLVVLSDEEAEIELARQQSHLSDRRIHTDDDQNTSTSYWRQLSPISPVAKDPLRILLSCYKAMALSLLDPSIIWALGTASIYLGVSIAQSLSFGTTLIKQGWAPENTGLIYLAWIPASLAAMVISGWGGDKINVAMARRNHGVHLPEHRLISLILPTFLAIGVQLIFGFCSEYYERVHWFAIVFSAAAFGTCFVCSLIVTTTYAVESLPSLAGPALVMVIGGKNLISFGTASAITPLVNSGRYAFGYGILNAALAGWLALGVPLYFYMPKYREWRDARK